jgi:hypothetical protein
VIESVRTKSARTESARSTKHEEREDEEQREAHEDVHATAAQERTKIARTKRIGCLERILHIEHPRER